MKGSSLSGVFLRESSFVFFLFVFAFLVRICRLFKF